MNDLLSISLLMTHEIPDLNTVMFHHNSDHLSMTMLTNNNYLVWSRSIKIALGTWVKLGFINEKCACRSEESSHYEQWVSVDCMVTSWVLNSIAKGIIEAFLYTLLQNYAMNLSKGLAKAMGLAFINTEKDELYLSSRLYYCSIFYKVKTYGMRLLGLDRFLIVYVRLLSHL